MGDDKVKESPSEVFATLADVNSAIHSLDDVFGVRFEAVEEKLAAMDIKNDSRFETVGSRFEALEARFRAVDVRFQAIEEKLAAMDIRNERQFEAIDAQFRAVDAQFRAVDAQFRAIQEKMAATDVNNERRFAALGTEIAELNARVKGGFGLLEEKVNSLEHKMVHTVTSAANKLMIMLLVIAGSIIASLLYVG